MLPLGMVVAFVGYGVSTWGYILVKGYNITAREWFSPLSPFTGNLDANGTVPPGHLWPTAKGAANATANLTADSTGQASGSLPPPASPAPQKGSGGGNFGTSNPNAVA